MSIEQEARAEAEKRWPTVGYFSAVGALRIAFINGYIARAHRPVTDAEADAAQAAFHEYLALASVQTELDLSVEQQAWKVALEAARNVNRETGDSES